LNLFDEDVLIADTSSAEITWFNIDTIKYKRLYKNVDLRKITLQYQANQIDNLLQNFEDLGLYEKEGLIDIDFIYDGFDSYVEDLWGNKEVQKYIAWLRSDPKGADFYAYFEYLYNKLKKHPLVKPGN